MRDLSVTLNKGRKREKLTLDGEKRMLLDLTQSCESDLPLLPLHFSVSAFLHAELFVAFCPFPVKSEEARLAFAHPVVALNVIVIPTTRTEENEKSLES